MGGVSKMVFLKHYLYLVLAAVFHSCQSNDPYFDNPERLFEAPEYFPEPTYSFDNLYPTEQNVQLGKQLFFDPILSADSSISCNTCHIQQVAFADNPLHRRSVGIDGKIGKRNAPPLANMAFFSSFLWDGGITHLDFVAVNAIESPVEMGDRLENVLLKLNRNQKYRTAFKEVYQLDSITAPFFLKSLSMFMVQMVSDQSKFDKHLRGEKSLNEDELAGLNLFEENCASCHSGVLQSSFDFKRNGLDLTENDLGLEDLTGNDFDRHRFRIPSLRNVAITFPYMHNASFNSLEEVVDHYRFNLNENHEVPSAKPLENGRFGIEMTETEKHQIVTFLKTLTDDEFRFNQKFRQ
jgi:cytochrome c peroxidase